MPGSSTTAALGRAVHRYRSAPLVARALVHGRAFLSDLAFVERFVPRHGFVVDLGCGDGLFANLLVEASPQRRVLGIDADEGRIALARTTVQGREALRFELGQILAEPPPKCDAVTIVNVLHLLPFDQQERLLRNAAAALGEDRPLVVKARERSLSPRYALTYGQELVSLGLGITRADHGQLFFATREQALATFERAGFIVEAVEMPDRPSTDVLYLARKAPTS